MKKCILVVDDERHVRTLLERTLDPFEEVNVDLMTAASGEDALELCRQKPPDLVFVDVGMPGIGGYAFCEALRSEPATQHATIILMIEMGREPNLDRCKAAQVAEVVTKPFDPDHIRLLTGKLLDIDVEL
jgi:two-component system, OmpR family, alkaline phosphatase synthesis response regulator PhoP